MSNGANNKNYYRTKAGVISQIYGGQKSSSKKRRHNAPSYSKEVFTNWLCSETNFDGVFEDWVGSGYEKSKRPSVDRLSDSLGYSLENIRLTTWGENEEKGNDDQRTGKLEVKANPIKAVEQYTLEGILVEEHFSLSEANRVTKVSIGNISSVCSGNRPTAGGYKWKFK